MQPHVARRLLEDHPRFALQRCSANTHEHQVDALLRHHPRDVGPRRGDENAATRVARPLTRDSSARSANAAVAAPRSFGATMAVTMSSRWGDAAASGATR